MIRQQIPPTTTEDNPDAAPGRPLSAGRCPVSRAAYCPAVFSTDITRMTRSAASGGIMPSPP